MLLWATALGRTGALHSKLSTLLSTLRLHAPQDSQLCFRQNIPTTCHCSTWTELAGLTIAKRDGAEALGGFAAVPGAPAEGICWEAGCLARQ